MTPESQLLPTDAVRELSRLGPWRAAAQGAMEWGWIALAVALATRLDSLLLYPLWVVLIGSRQHALAILMHDAAHSRAHPDRRWNDAIGELLFAWPILVSMRAYRRTHLAHHQHLQTPLDADWRIWRDHAYYWFPMKRGALVGEIVRFSLGLRTLKLFEFLGKYANRDARPAALRETPAGTAPRRRDGLDRARVPYYLVAAAGVTAAGAWGTVALYWVVPLLTATMGMLYVRAVAEHFISEDGGPDALPCSRSMRYNLVERLLLAPLNVGYHLEHHLYPSVPFYRLDELHRRLLAVDEFRARARFTQGVAGVIRECESSHSTRGLWEKQLARRAQAAPS